MYNFFKGFFGLSPDDCQRPRNDNEDPNDIPPDEWENRNTFFEGNQIPRDLESNPFGFPIFNDFFEIHNFVDGFINEMQKNMNFFGFGNHPHLTLEEEGENSSFMNEGKYLDYHQELQFNEKHQNDSLTLRNSYLKSPDTDTKIIHRRDTDLDGRVKAEDVENLLSNEKPPVDWNSGKLNPTIYSKSVYIRTIRHPDGRVETIKKVRDHTGKEETIITQDNSQSPSDHKIIPPDDQSGISIFKKFFPF